MNGMRYTQGHEDDFPVPWEDIEEDLEPDCGAGFMRPTAVPSGQAKRSPAADSHQPTNNPHRLTIVSPDIRTAILTFALYKLFHW